MKGKSSKTVKSAMAGGLTLCLLTLLPLTAMGQRLLTLDSCRTMALRNNKQMRVAAVKQDVAANMRKAARTKYLPHLSAVGSYEHTSREVSLLNETQKSLLPNMGSVTMASLQPQMQGLGQSLQQLGGTFVKLGVPAADVQQTLGSMQTQLTDGSKAMAAQLNGIGAQIVDAFHTDTRNLWAGSILLTQPVFMGGAIVAMNKMADIGEQMTENSAEARRQATLYNIDHAYWQVVSLTHKKRLAESYSSSRCRH